MEHAIFVEETIKDMKELLKISFKESSGPCGDLDQSFHEFGELPQAVSSINSAQLKHKKKKVQTESSRKKRREQHFIVRDMILALALCHNVTPVYPDEDDPTKKEYQASSPDEVALVKFADSMEMNLVQREE